MTTFTQRVQAAADDGLDRTGSAFFTTNPTTDLGAPLITGESGAGANYWWMSGFRFSGVTIPQGTTITSAKVTFTGYSTRSGFPAYTVPIYCEAVDNSANFTTNANIVSRTPTTANTSWTTPTSTTADVTFDTPDITSAVQEVIDRAGWASGNALMVMCRTTGGTADDNGPYAYFYEDSTTKCALLTITYGSTTNSGFLAFM